MFKDIITHLSVRNDDQTIRDYAISVARMLEAQLSGIAMAFALDTPGQSMGYLPIGKIEAEQRGYEAAQTALDRFAAATTRAGVLCSAGAAND
jgi:hypothetical protein